MKQFGGRLGVWFACAAALALSSAAGASDFPSKTVRIVIPFTAGGAPDVLLRMVAGPLSEKWKQPVVIENRPGANTNIGTVAVTKAEADGHTLLFTTDGTFIFNPLIYTAMPYSVSELTPISMVATASHMLSVGTHVPANDVAEFVALAKSKPGQINYGSTGPASIQRLQMELFMALTGTQLTHVPFKGANETTMAMLANQMDATIGASSNALPHLPTKRLRALAITTTRRSPLAPEIPTMQESGVPGYETYSVFGLFAPAKTPAETIKKIHDDVTEIITQPEIKALLAGRSFDVEAKNAADFQTVIERDTVKWRKVITDAKIKDE